MSVAEAQSKISSSEFVQWRFFLEDEPNQFSPLFYYLAQIAREVRMSRIFSSSKKQLRLEDFLIKFKSHKAKPSTSVNTKGIWMSWLGLGGKK